MHKLIHFIYYTVLGFVLKVIGSAMVLSVVIQIACRYLPITPLRWTEELARLTFIWFSFLGAAMTLSRLQHLSIDYFFNKLGPGARYALDVFTWLAVTAFSGVIAVYGFRLTGIVAMQRSPMLQLPMSFFYAAVPVGCVLYAFYGFTSLVWCLIGKNKALALSD